MGRKRVPEEEKKIDLKLSVKTKYVKELKERNINISQLFEEFVKNYLKR
jgi:post-segregation antitoxin (ccd killing protein)